MYNVYMLRVCLKENALLSDVTLRWLYIVNKWNQLLADIID